MKLLSIDPGKLNVGWALFDDGLLLCCGLIRAENIESMAEKIDDDLEDAFRMWTMPEELCIEVPQIYGRRDEKDPNDCIDIALVAGMFAGSFQNAIVTFVRPREWKKQVPKPIHNKRVLKCLEPAELKVYEEVACIASLRHNILDSIGIGLWKLGRT